jgi:hypothetical protein
MVCLVTKEVIIMGTTREYLRENSYSPCILSYRDINYRAQLKNISIGGASIKVDSDLQSILNIGDHIELKLYHPTESYSTNYACEVARLDSSELGVSCYKLF